MRGMCFSSSPSQDSEGGGGCPFCRAEIKGTEQIVVDPFSPNGGPGVSRSGSSAAAAGHVVDGAGAVPDSINLIDCEEPLPAPAGASGSSGAAAAAAAGPEREVPK